MIYKNFEVLGILYIQYNLQILRNFYGIINLIRFRRISFVFFTCIRLIAHTHNFILHKSYYLYAQNFIRIPIVDSELIFHTDLYFSCKLYIQTLFLTSLSSYSFFFSPTLRLPRHRFSTSRKF